MDIYFQKVSQAKHVLKVVRRDGSVDAMECETRSFLMHDFLHFALESEAQLQGGFWGSLAAGTTFAALSAGASLLLQSENSEAALAEKLAGLLHALTQGRSPEEVYAMLVANAATSEVPLPTLLTRPFVFAVAERLRRLTGHWHKTRYGETMHLTWTEVMPTAIPPST